MTVVHMLLALPSSTFSHPYIPWYCMVFMHRFDLLYAAAAAAAHDGGG